MTQSQAVRLSRIMDGVWDHETALDRFVYNTGMRDPRISDAHAALTKAKVLLREVVAEQAINELTELGE